MPNKHFCQGPNCHERTTNDRFLKSRGVLRGKYAYATLDADQNQYGWTPPDSDKYFCSQGCKHDWLNINMNNIEQGRPIEFIRHRRESGGYEKVVETSEYNPDYKWNTIKRVDNVRE